MGRRLGKERNEPNENTVLSTSNINLLFNNMVKRKHIISTLQMKFAQSFSRI